MISKPYKVMQCTINDEHCIYVSGPGIFVWHSGNEFLSATDQTIGRLSNERDAQTASECANAAYKIGYAHAQADMRNALGIKVPTGRPTKPLNTEK